MHVTRAIAGLGDYEMAGRRATNGDLDRGLRGLAWVCVRECVHAREGVCVDICAWAWGSSL